MLAFPCIHKGTYIKDFGVLFSGKSVRKLYGASTVTCTDLPGVGGQSSAPIGLNVYSFCNADNLYYSTPVNKISKYNTANDTSANMSNNVLAAGRYSAQSVYYSAGGGIFTFGGDNAVPVYSSSSSTWSIGGFSSIEKFDSNGTVSYVNFTGSYNTSEFGACSDGTYVYLFGGISGVLKPIGTPAYMGLAQDPTVSNTIRPGPGYINNYTSSGNDYLTSNYATSYSTNAKRFNNLAIDSAGITLTRSYCRGQATMLAGAAYMLGGRSGTATFGTLLKWTNVASSTISYTTGVVLDTGAATFNDKAHFSKGSAIVSYDGVASSVVSTGFTGVGYFSQMSSVSK